MRKVLSMMLFNCFILVAVATMMLNTGCTKEGPAGPPGANGTNGTNGANGATGAQGQAGQNGTNGLNGKDASLMCLKCHTQANFDAKRAQYSLSKHYYGNTSARGISNAFCCRCHTNEGFQEITSRPWNAGDFIVVGDAYPNATRITCETCHLHTGFDFPGDTLQDILRTNDPLYLNYNMLLGANEKLVDFGAINPAGKTNNLCCTCHQIRGATSLVYSDSTKNINGAANAHKTYSGTTVTSVSFKQLPYFPFPLPGATNYPVLNDAVNNGVNYQVGQSIAVHDGNQSNLFYAMNGFEYTGYDYTQGRTTSNFPHYGAKCTFCHMNAVSADGSTGGHTLKINRNAPSCNIAGCHTGGLSGLITADSLAVQTYLKTLGDLLVARKVFKKSGTSYSAEPNADFYGTIFPTTSTTTYFATAIASNNTVGATTGLLVYGNMITWAKDTDYANRIGRKWSWGEMGAAYNYGFVSSESSPEIHNKWYALALLQSSINWLQAN